MTGNDDLVIGANGVGTVYVVYGRTPASPFPAVFELSSLNGTNGFSVSQLAASDYLGTAVAGPGDVNGDGIDDLLLGAYGADPSGRSAAGQAYVIFGRSSFPAAFSLSSLNGTTGFTMNGSAAGGYLGYQVDGAGDVNGDGIADLLLSAISIAGPAGTYTGAGYVVFGHAAPFASVLEISALNGSNGTAFYGPAAGTQAGYRLQGVGDVNGDDYDDIFLGATVCRSARPDQCGPELSCLWWAEFRIKLRTRPVALGQWRRWNRRHRVQRVCRRRHGRKRRRVG